MQIWLHIRSMCGVTKVCTWICRRRVSECVSKEEGWRILKKLNIAKIEGDTLLLWRDRGEGKIYLGSTNKKKQQLVQEETSPSCTGANALTVGTAFPSVRSQSGRSFYNMKSEKKKWRKPCLQCFWEESNRTLTNNFDAHWGNATHMKRQESRGHWKLFPKKNFFQPFNYIAVFF